MAKAKPATQIVFWDLPTPDVVAISAGPIFKELSEIVKAGRDVDTSKTSFTGDDVARRSDIGNIKRPASAFDHPEYRHAVRALLSVVPKMSTEEVATFLNEIKNIAPEGDLPNKLYHDLTGKIGRHLINSRKHKRIAQHSQEISGWIYDRLGNLHQQLRDYTPGPSILASMHSLSYFEFCLFGARMAVNAEKTEANEQPVYSIDQTTPPLVNETEFMAQYFGSMNFPPNRNALLGKIKSGELKTIQQGRVALKEVYSSSRTNAARASEKAR
jgi:hypothetical protein